MKLYEVPPNSKIRVIEPSIRAFASPDINKGDILFFKHMDGLLGLCVDENGAKLYPSALTEVEIIP